jgi:phospholipid-binding lipoprotein MlaA
LTALSFLPSLLLVATPAQGAQALPPVPAGQAAPAADATSAPVGAGQASTQGAPKESGAAELRDPLADPATAPVAGQPQAKHAHDPEDPLEGFNRTMFMVHMKLDRALYRPAALGYRDAVPKPIRKGLRNFFSNLTEPVVFVNYLLQLKPEHAMRTLARFTINITVGIGGVLDVAKARTFSLPHVSNNFGDTFAYYGIGPGPYIFIPFIGPSTLRDFLGGPADSALLPLIVGVPFDKWQYSLASAVLIGLDSRAEHDGEFTALLKGAVDPYATLRSAYLQNRAAEVEALHEKKAEPQATPELTDPLADPAAKQSPAAPKSDAPELRDPLEDPAARPPAAPATATP